MLNFYPPRNYFDPLVWVSGDDLVLEVGQSAKITASAATSIPLHIACGDGQIYEIDISGTFTPAAAGAHTLLLFNNSTSGTNFTRLHVTDVGVTVSGNSLNVADTGFLLAFGSSILHSKSTLFVSTTYKCVETISRSRDTTNGNRISTIGNESQDTTTVWSSLGTITLPNAWTGVINVRRVA